MTGANQGIGAAIAEALAADGAAVLATFLRLPGEHADPALPAEYARLRAQSADDVVAGIRLAGGRVEAREADLADPSTVPALFDRAESVFGPVDILINNASGWLANTFLPARRDRFAVDARAPALLIAEFARRHIGRNATWGRIVGLTSGGPGGFPEEVSYGAAKAAQENYTMSAAAELAAYGVTANMVYPPVTDTGWITDSVRATAADAGPIGRVAEPADVAEVVLLLTSERARFITGQIIRMS